MKSISPKQQKRIIISACLTLVGLVLLATGAAYGINANNQVISNLQKIYPAALVGSGMISIHDWNEYRSLAAATGDSAKAYDQLIKVKKEAHIASKLRAHFGDAGKELNYYKSQNSDEYNEILAKYFGGQEDLFNKYVVRPQANEASLRIKYNQDLSANLTSFNRAQNILNKIKDGQKFEDVAKTQSDDQITGQLGGDLGFAPLESFLPELQPEINSNALGKPITHLVTSRYGYHILYPVETAEKDGQKLWHVKHILVAPSGFDQWLNLQLKNVWVWQIK